MNFQTNSHKKHYIPYSPIVSARQRKGSFALPLLFPLLAVVVIFLNSFPFIKVLHQLDTSVPESGILLCNYLIP